jgi:hypothetical protein
MAGRPPPWVSCVEGKGLLDWWCFYKPTLDPCLYMYVCYASHNSSTIFPNNLPSVCIFSLLDPKISKQEIAWGKYNKYWCIISSLTCQMYWNYVCHSIYKCKVEDDVSFWNFIILYDLIMKKVKKEKVVMFCQTHRYCRCSRWPSSGTRLPDKFELPKSLQEIQVSESNVRNDTSWKK